MAATGGSMGAEATPEVAQTLGHYRLLGEAGRGGMSVVYEAMDDRFGRRVALKALAFPLASSEDLRSATVARFKREARAVARLSHPNVVTIFDIGEERRQHYLVMEFLEGRTLKERLQEGPLPYAEAAHVLDQLASGLDAVHAAGIIHRDVKPSNVMLLPGGRVKLMDFGVARGSEDTLVTQAGMMVGSPAYMAPEQIHGEALGPACDVWALGVLTYEMLAGKPPFSGGSIPKVVYQVTHDAPPRLPGASPSVQNVLKRALAKNPAQRYPSAREMADAFRAAGASPQPQSAAPAPRPLPAAPPPRPPRPLLLAAAPRRARFALPPRPVLWAGGLLLAVLAAALPQALHKPRAPASRVVFVQPPSPAATRHRSPHTPPPVVARVDSYWQEQRSRPVTTAYAGTRLARKRLAQGRIARKRAYQERLTQERLAREAVAFQETLQNQAARDRAAQYAVQEKATQERVSREAVARSNAAQERAARKRATARIARKKAAQKQSTRDHVARSHAPQNEASAQVMPISLPVHKRRHPVQAPIKTVEQKPPPPQEAASDVSPPVEKTPAPTKPPVKAGAGRSLLGTWRGRHSRNPAVLTVTHQDGNTFSGTLSVRTHEASVRVAVEGRVSPGGGVSMHERRILSSSAPRAWDLGSETGHVAGSGRMEGTGTDVKGRSGSWSFSR